MVNNSLIYSIAFDGTDGSGKTSLINKLSENFFVVSLPRFYAMGAVPLDPLERKNWFLSVSQKDAMKIYLTAHKHRLTTLKYFKEGLHYKLLEKTEKTKLLVADRGYLSVEAFAYAALKCENEMSDKEIYDFIDVYFRNEMKDIVNSYFDLTVLLAGDPKEYLDKVIARRNYEQHDIDLIKNQAEYLHKRNFPIKRILKLSPINDFNENFNILQKTILSLGEKHCI